MCAWGDTEVKINRQLEKRKVAQGSPSVAVTRRVPVTHVHTETTSASSSRRKAAQAFSCWSVL